MGSYEDPRAGLEEPARLRAADGGPPDPLVTEVAARLRAGQGVAAVAGAVGPGERQLHPGVPPSGSWGVRSTPSATDPGHWGGSCASSGPSR
nr:hypothetical protein [Streptomyces sp. H34-S4]